MTKEGLNYINSLFESLDIPYEFIQWNSTVPSTYFVGEYIEIEPMNEDGYEETTFILSGITNKSFLELENVKKDLKQMIGNEGITTILSNGCGIGIFYNGSQVLPSVEYGVHRLQINLNVKEWKVN